MNVSHFCPLPEAGPYHEPYSLTQGLPQRVTLQPGLDLGLEDFCWVQLVTHGLPYL